MEQNSTEWLEWRKLGLGGSDAPIVMGVSPYTTRLELYEDKLGIRQQVKKNSYVMNLGHAFEPKVRARFEIESGVEVEPEIVEMEGFEWLRASLDAANLSYGLFAEIKYMGKKNFKICKETSAPLDHHYPQLQHQFMVTGFEKGIYIPYTLTDDKKDIEDFTYIECTPNKVYIESHLFPELKRFWDCVLNKVPPSN